MAKAKGPAPRKSGPTRGITVALTGASGKLGGLLLERLLSERSVAQVVVFDLNPPALSHAKLRFQPLDLTSTSVDRVLAEALTALKVEALAHLPILTHPADPAYAHEVEAIGTFRLLAGLAQSPVKRLVMVSTTSVYGALPSHPNHLEETRPLLGAPGSRYLSDRVEMERQVATFRSAHPERTVTVLRFPPIVGAGVFDPFASYLSRRFAPMVLGYDPLIQVIHVEDALRAIQTCLEEDKPGDYNVASQGVLPLSAALRWAGVRPLYLPHLGTRGALRLFNTLGLTRTPVTLLDFVRYLCVADLRKAEQAGLGPRFTIEDALSALAEFRVGSSSPAYASSEVA